MSEILFVTALMHGKRARRMSNYIKREDAIKQIVKGEEMYGEEFATDTGRVKDFLNVLPSADVVEVVRCKDCIYCKKGG